MRFNDFQTEGRISALENSLREKVNQHEISSLRGTVDHLEYSLREARIEIDELRSQLYHVQEAVEQLQRMELQREEEKGSN